MRRGLLILAACAAAVLAGCGEDRPATAYKQGKYQGKTDTEPWSGGEFKGDKAAWENAIKQRNQAQNEYQRMGDGPGGKL
jgi:ABC-type glycerol-3-phosphate transport system substrate-binding protein